MKNLYLIICTILLASFSLIGQIDIEKSVLISADFTTDPPSTILKWAHLPGTTSLTVRRKLITTPSWGPTYATLGENDSTFTDTDVEIGEPWEYQITRFAAAGTGFGYAFCGQETPAIERGGILIMVIESNVASELETEIDQYQSALTNENWLVKEIIVETTDAITDIHDQIESAFFEDPINTKSVLLFGHVPVPYSGNIAPDGHVPDHQGAWPVDAYYGDISGTWTDVSVNVTGATGTQNDNVPGDGKFDQSLIVSEVELEVGRIDFFDLPAFAESEIELLRNYIQKDIAFRTKAFTPERRGLVENNFSNFAEGFGQNGWKNFVPLVGPSNVAYLDYRATLQSGSYLWSYGCGAGSYTSAGGITNTANFAADSLQSVFTLLFGSYFGDWNKPNNLLRAAIASGSTLTNAWAGRPNWQFHHMALGENIGLAARLAQNNSNLYVPGFGARQIHIAFMGDPTLRLHSVSGVSQLEIGSSDDQVKISWDSSSDDVVGYYVYHRSSDDTFFERIHPDLITDNTYNDLNCHPFGSEQEYMVRAVKLEETPSGTYYNLSPGLRSKVIIQSMYEAIANFDTDVNLFDVEFTNSSETATEYFWNFGDTNTSNEESPTHTYSMDGTYMVQLIAANPCNSDTITTTINIVTPVTAEFQAKPSIEICEEEALSLTLLHTSSSNATDVLWLLPGATPDQSTEQNPVVTYPGTGNYDITLIASNAGFSDTLTIVDAVQIIDRSIDLGDGFTFDSDLLTVQFFPTVTGAMYIWDFGDGSPFNNEESPSHTYLAPGMYDVNLFITNGACTVDTTINIEVSSVGIFDVSQHTELSIHPNPTTDYVNISIGSTADKLQILSLYDALGNLIATYKDIDATDVSINLDGLASGNYVIKGLSINGISLNGKINKLE